MVGHNCDAPISVTVNGTGIPVIDEGVTVYERKDGPTSITRRAEVHFPIDDGETVWLEEIDAFREGGTMEQARVEMQAIDINGNPTGDYQPMVEGYVGAVGSRGAANTGRITIFGPFKLLSSIPAGVSWDETRVRATDALQWVVDRFNDGQEIFNDVTLDADGFERLAIGVGETDNGDRFLADLPKFTENRDTLADVIRALTNRLNMYLWFEPTADGELRLRARPQIDDEVDTYDLTNGGDVPVISNDALYEMRPFNGITLRGKSATEVGVSAGSVDFSVDAPVGDGKYPRATAVYEPLKERAGGEILQTANSKATSIKEIEAEARSVLKDQLDEITGGTMDTALAPQVHPFDKIEARPACATVINSDIPTLTYEVERTAHTLAPDPGDGEIQIPSSELAVSMYINPDKITVESSEETTQPSKAGENKPPDNDPSDGFTWGFN